MITHSELVGAKIAELAKTWLNTPYLHMGRVRGAGADCAMMPLEVYTEAGVLSPTSIEFYSQQWALHREREVYLELVEKAIAGTSIHQVAPPPERTPIPGDFLLFKFARTYSHGAIVIAWPLCIHAHVRRGVIYVDALLNKPLAERIDAGLVKCFSLESGNAAPSASEVQDVR